MKHLTLIFQKLVQDAVEFGSDEQQSISRVFFDLEDETSTHSLYVDVREPVGGTHQEGEVEVLPLEGYRGNFDQDAFKEAVKTYYQGIVNSAGYGKHLAKDKGFRSQGDELAKHWVVELAPMSPAPK